MPPEPHSENQLNYARDLGIKIPENASKDDSSNLITFKLDKDRPYTERHKRFADLYGIFIPKYIGKKVLFDIIHARLNVAGSEKELISWFTFRVYRSLVKGVDNAPMDSPTDPVIIGIADELKNDQRVINSIRRYGGRDLVWFGEWTSPDGYTYNGGSNRTIAYKTAAEKLRERATFPEKRMVPDQPKSKRKKNKKEASAIPGFIVIGILIYVLWKCVGP